MEASPARSRVRDLCAFLLLVAAVLAFLALVTYQPSDPSLNSAGANSSAVAASGALRVQNWVGVVGAIVSDLLYQSVGWGAYFVVVGLLVLAVVIWRGVRVGGWGLRLIGVALGIAAFCALAEIALRDWDGPFAGGGVVGAAIGLLALRLFSHVGSVLVLVAMFVTALFMAMRVSPVDLARGAVRWVFRPAGRALRRTAAIASDVARGVGSEVAAGAGGPAIVVGGVGDEEEKSNHGDTEALSDEKDEVEGTAAGTGAGADADAAAGPAVLSQATPTIVPPTPRRALGGAPEDQTILPLALPPGEYTTPSITLLDYAPPGEIEIDREALLANARRLEAKLRDYKVEGEVREIHPGPVVTMYEFAPAPGLKLSRITSLSDDLALALEAERVRIVAPIPGKGVVGIEVPNGRRETVYLREIIGHASFRTGSKLALALGKDIAGEPVVADLSRMPHLLVAGATGSGKSVSINSMIVSILMNATPDEVRMLMVDPKMLELSLYDGIPHLLLPVVTDPKKAAVALRWAVDEMGRRYQLLSEQGVRHISGFNKRVEKLRASMPERPPEPSSRRVVVKRLDQQTPDCDVEEDAQPEAKPIPEKLPYIVIVIDELADLMMVASKDVESCICRLAQLARAAGIHLITATQRPSVDVITGVIKANFPARISFKVTSKEDSRTILGSMGAEKLLGNGDMLFIPPGKSDLVRVHGALVTEDEIKGVVEFLKKQGAPEYDESILARELESEDGQIDDEDVDEMYDACVAFAADNRVVSTSLLQRKFSLGYSRAAKIMDIMAARGIVGPPTVAGKPREVLIPALP